MFIDVSPSMSFDSSWVNILKCLHKKKKIKKKKRLSILKIEYPDWSISGWKPAGLADLTCRFNFLARTKHF